MYRQQTVDVLTTLYDWCNLDPTNIDDETYLLLKKFAGVGSLFSSLTAAAKSSVR